ncbi:type II toxin-antitoxin system RelE/ParE family toxin [Microvirga arsenatis]|uniref:Type II toxin-antitoxin system RelE/ParE family toxin n=1 Tax=Microvirga arsenatis TaxID=2692265 RepID=A0ABW9Z397_9HYPH|nr:type II toxin-antitoxin system RelE/ParE family toxin [Microvirga arsenatis]NBJ13691.1 type II toxin-antitoxin system RelE/ParE family toxin [Microvirga arsenatis]NBJ27159.1 type II toxin-antitoxin system RelE/ParE family toxin [Microvirga arsenatis]
MIEVRQTLTFKKWMKDLQDQRAVERIAQRIVRLESGLFGDVKPVGSGVSELRIDHGPGYRVYFTKQNNSVIVLLCAGDKGSQKRDIKSAIAMAEDL